MESVYVIDEFVHAGLSVVVGYDGDVHPDTNPRSEDSARFGVMVMRELDRYGDFADEHWDEQEELCERCEGEGELRVTRPSGFRSTESCDACEGTGQETINHVEYARRQGARVALGLYFRAHGPQCGVGTNDVNIIDDADCGNADGVIFDTPNDVRANGWQRAPEERIIEALASEVKCMGWYLEGSVYAYEIEDANGDHVDSCYGFLDGDDRYVTEEAKASAEAHANDPDVALISPDVVERSA